KQSGVAPSSGPQAGSSGEGSDPTARNNACPTDFSAEVTDISEAQHGAAAKIVLGAKLSIELVEEDPAFLNDGETLGWLSVNIEEVAGCLRAGWRYQGEVQSNDPSPAGPIIIAWVTCKAPPK
ncbi:MAG TPA: hypothetical protein VK560_07880, partial [Gemmatimonadaceae bacterium]|nr:hypothetical protein [Gemmatimonadaceae bacterium]